MVSKITTIWLTNGNRNTKYFHSRTRDRRKSNIIEGIIIKYKVWCFDDDMLKQHVVGFFQKLYIIEPKATRIFPCFGMFPPLLSSDQDLLSMEDTRKEIHKAVFSMALLKALKIDVVHARFYRSQWETMSGFVCVLIQKVFRGKCLDLNINKILLVLIPKIQGLECIS